MPKIQVPYSYLPLGEAAAELELKPSRLLHAGGMGEVQICMNVYARNRDIVMKAYSFEDDGTEGMSSEEIEELKAESEVLLKMTREQLEENQRQWEKRKQWSKHAQEMPAGIYQLLEDDIRRLEMPETESVEIFEALKKNEDGWWSVEFQEPLLITNADLVVLKEEIRHWSKENEKEISASAEKILGAREKNSYLRIIGAMLELLKNPRPGRLDDAAVIRELLANYSDREGISERNLAAKFAEAKRLLDL
jgi:hypothetical protein